MKSQREEVDNATDDLNENIDAGDGAGVTYGPSGRAHSDAGNPARRDLAHRASGRVALEVQHA